MKSVSFDFSKIEKLEDKSNKDQEASKEEKDNQENEMNNDYFIDEIIYKEPNQKWYHKIYRYCKNSSLFIFHRDWKIRKYLIALVVSPEMHQEYVNKMKDEGYSVNDDQSMLDRSNSMKVDKYDDLDESRNDLITSKCLFSNLTIYL